jgi:hypothetical protein
VILPTSMGRFPGNRTHRLGLSAVYAVICIATTGHGRKE